MEALYTRSYKETINTPEASVPSKAILNPLVAPISLLVQILIHQLFNI